MMKKIILTLAVLCLVINANAQLDQGDWLFGGNLDLSFQNREDAGGDRMTFAIEPQAGYFVSDVFVVGLMAGLDYANTKNDLIANGQNIELNRTTTSIYAGPFVRYYYSVSEKLAFMGQGAVTYRMINYTQEDFVAPDIQESETDETRISVIITPGVTYFLSDDIGIDFTMGSIGFNNAIRKVGNLESKSSDIWVDFNLTNVGLGLFLYLP